MTDGGADRWSTAQRKTIYLCAFVLGVSLLFLGQYLQIMWHVYALQGPGHPPPFGDFFPLRSYATIAGDHPAVELYNMALLHGRQVALGMMPAANNPFPYPPTAMLLFAPLRGLPYDAAYLAWTVGSFALFMWAVGRTVTRLWPCLLFALISPAATGNIFMGQSGFISAALLTAGLRLAPNRPVAGGMLIGLLSYKPQLGLLVPVALAAAGMWRALAAAGATVVALALAATLLFGCETWAAWLSMLPAYADLVDQTSGLAIMCSVVANLEMAGVPLAAAKLAQAVTALAVAVLVYRCFRRDAGKLATAALLTGVFLATPHAFFYDLPMVTAAMALFVQARIDSRGTFTTFEVCVLVLAALFPITMLVRAFPLPTSFVPLALLFLVIVRAENRGLRQG
jgi:hypothetical protein